MNTINNQTNRAEYSELYRKLQNEVAEQNMKTAQLPQNLFDNDDKVDFNNYNAQNINIEIEKLKQSDVISAVTSLVTSIKQNSGSAYQTQNSLLLGRIAALLKS